MHTKQTDLPKQRINNLEKTPSPYTSGPCSKSPHKKAGGGPGGGTCVSLTGAGALFLWECAHRDIHKGKKPRRARASLFTAAEIRRQLSVHQQETVRPEEREGPETHCDAKKSKVQLGPRMPDLTHTLTHTHVRTYRISRTHQNMTKGVASGRWEQSGGLTRQGTVLGTEPRPRHGQLLEPNTWKQVPSWLCPRSSAS